MSTYYVCKVCEGSTGYNPKYNSLASDYTSCPLFEYCESLEPGRDIVSMVLRHLMPTLVQTAKG